MSSESPAEPRHIVLTPAEAASGTMKMITVSLAGEPPRTLGVNVPAGVIDGNRLSLPGVGPINPLTGERNDLYVSVRVARRRMARSTQRRLFGVGAVLMLGLIIGLVVANSGPSTNNAGSSSSDTPAAGSDLPTFLPDTTDPSVASVPPVITPEIPSYVPPILPPLVPSVAPTNQVFDAGTCLNGQLPDSTVAVSVSDVNEVPCTSADAHYRVIQNFPGTTDLNVCNSNPRTQYAFSSELDMNGLPTDQYVYCLVGIGKYSR